MKNNYHKPPGWISKLLHRYVDDYFIDAIYGDLHDEFLKNLRRRGHLYARILFIWNATEFLLRNFTLKKNKNPTPMTADLFLTYFKTSIRYFKRRKAYFIFNVIGLAIGLGSSLAIWKYVEHERSYDRFHQEGIYRVIRNTTEGPGLANSKPDLATFMKDGFTQVKEATRFFARSNSSARVVENSGPKVIKNVDFLYADPFFLSIFSFEEARTNRTMLSKPNEAVITESLSQKLFGTTDDVVGRNVSFKDPNFPLIDYLITAVVPDIPENSHFSFDALVSLSTPLRNGQSMNDMGWTGFYTYLLLNHPTDERDLKTQLPEFSKTYFGDQNDGISLGLQSINSIHLHSRLNHEIGVNGDAKTVKYFTIAAIIILLMAYINYINLATAQSLDRAKEMGVRRVFGSNKSYTRYHFFVETLVLNLSAFMLAVLVVRVSVQYLPYTSNLEALYTFSITELGFLLLLLIAGSLLSAIYPSQVLSSFKVLKIIQNQTNLSSRTVNVRGLLTVLQFAISGLMILVTLVVSTQLNFMMNSDKGVDLDQVLIINPPDVRDEMFGNRMESFRNKVNQYSFVKSFSTASTTPGLGYNYSAQARLLGDDLNTPSTLVYTDGIDDQFIDHYGINLLSGRTFDSALPDERGKVLLNQTARNMLGFVNNEDALLEKLIMGDDTLEIIGVIENYNHRSLRESYDAQVLAYYGNYTPHFSVRFTSTSTADIISNLNQISDDYREIFAGSQPDTYFLDEKFNQQYHTDRSAQRVSKYFTFVSLLITIIGLVGFISFLLAKKVKQIALRRVLGATRKNIILDQGRPIMQLLAFSSIVSISFGYIFSESWLNQYAFRITLSPVHYVAPLLIIAFISLCILVISAAKILSENPIKWIRDE